MSPSFTSTAQTSTLAEPNIFRYSLYNWMYGCLGGYRAKKSVAIFNVETPYAKTPVTSVISNNTMTRFLSKNRM